MRRTALLATLTGAAMLAAGTASATPFTGIYAFGDSLSDAGNLYLATGGTEPVSPPYSQGRFSNGPVWVQDLSQSLGLGSLTPSLAGGTDFAYGGAQTGTTPVHTANLLDLPSQLAQYNAAVHTPQPNALYTLWIGANDLFSILATPGVTQAQARTDAAAAVHNVVSFVSGLAADGAHNLMVLTVPNLGLTPGITAEGPAAVAAATALSARFDTALLGTLDPLAAADSLHLYTVDTYSLLDATVADPAAFGFSNVTDPCWTGNFTNPRSGTVCSPTLAGQDSHLFWDDVHPTAAGHLLVADAAEAAVPEPASLTLLAGGLAVLAFVRRRPG